METTVKYLKWAVIVLTVLVLVTVVYNAWQAWGNTTAKSDAATKKLVTDPKVSE